MHEIRYRVRQIFISRTSSNRTTGRVLATLIQIFFNYNYFTLITRHMFCRYRWTTFLHLPVPLSCRPTAASIFIQLETY